MNTKTIEKNWSEIKTQITAKWSKLQDHELDALKSDLGQLVGKVQSAYGSAKDVAEREFEDFKQSVHNLLSADAEVAAPAKASWVITAEPVTAPAKKLH